MKQERKERKKEREPRKGGRKERRKDGKRKEANVGRIEGHQRRKQSEEQK